MQVQAPKNAMHGGRVQAILEEGTAVICNVLQQLEDGEVPIVASGRYDCIQKPRAKGVPQRYIAKPFPLSKQHMATRYRQQQQKYL